MHSEGLELAKLTYTRLKDNLIRHRGDGVYAISSEYGRFLSGLSSMAKLGVSPLPKLGAGGAIVMGTRGPYIYIQTI